MKLTELEPQFLRYEKTAASTVFHYVDRIDDAQGIRFLCPKCFQANAGKVGTHGVICWSSSRGVADDAQPGPGRWRLVGTGYGDLSLMEEPGKSRSVLLRGDCAWHGFVTNGEVTSA
jgi:hypothetical protein